MAPQDSFIDDEEEYCPLCIEELDPSDKNFKPCPCGYQICQFCFNNIRNNNAQGLCPACRRPYNDKTIEWKAVSQEEMAQYRVIAAKKEKKKAEMRQKETQKREVESANRKHLAGLRVVQKNLVYVVGLSPGIREDEILQTLRGDKYFGQYGKIIKIVVSKAKQTDSSQNGSLGVYVTFARNEDAARCIAAVNGSQNGDRVLRAQLGTTKYCSAYLRNEICNNKQCMFLHESGDNDDSYSRQDLSSINSANTQRPLASTASSSRQAALAQAPIAQVQPISAATHPMVRDNSNQDSESGGDNSALPSSASWANRGLHQQRSRRGSYATSGAASSPAVSHVMPATAEAIEEPPQAAPETTIENPLVPPPEVAVVADSLRVKRNPLMMKLLKDFNCLSSFEPPTGDIYNDSSSSYPPLFDDNGGMKRKAMREHQEEARLHLEQEEQEELASIPEPLEEEEPESGSLQLGGEPEDRDAGREGNMSQGFQRRPSAQLPIQRGPSAASFGGNLGHTQNLSNLTSINGRTLTPMQQQQLLLMKSAAQPQSNFMDQYPPGIGNHLSQGSTLFQQQGHNRQSSRYSFANDSSSATSVKPSANPKTMAQQSSMMPSGSHSQQGQFFGSSMPGPPPGLKSSGTPPIGMFGQGQSFSGTLGSASGFAGVAKENQNEMLREMLRPRGVGGSQAHESGKHDPDSVDDEVSSSVEHSVEALLAGSLDEDYPSRRQDGFGFVSRPSTPSVPPGFESSHGHPAPAIRDDSVSKPPSRMTATTAEFTPSRVRVATPLSQVSVPPSPVHTFSSKVNHGASSSQAKADTKALATSSGLAKTIAQQSSQPPLQSVDFPALEIGKGKGKPADQPNLAPGLASSPPTATKKMLAGQSSTSSSAVSSNYKLTEKKTPGILNVSVQKPTPKVLSSSEGLPTKAVITPADFPALKPSVPQSSLPRNAPKTLRISAPSRTESASTPIPTPSSTVSGFPPHISTSRQPSFASMPRLEGPGTPTSEVISDNASLTSTSLSRASSPPPAKIGSAPVRENTKSMQKKNRVQKAKEKAEQDAAAAAAAKPLPAPVEIAPVMGRKKKQKKERAISNMTATSTPSASRAPSPTPPEPVEEEPSKGQDVVEEAAKVVEKPTPPAESAKPAVISAESKGKGKVKAQPAQVSEPAPVVATVEDEITEKPIPTPASILQELIAKGDVPPIDTLSLLKNPVSTFKHQEIPYELLAADKKLSITPEDKANLLAGKPVHKIPEGPNRILLTPNGDCVRNLSVEEEKRYLDLQTRISEAAGPTAFVSAKHHTGNGFTLIGGRAVPNGPPPFFPSPANLNTPAMDPVSKIQRDEALSYINQYVLPSLSSNSQLEKALNANAFDKNLIRTGDPANWAEWGSDSPPSQPENLTEDAVDHQETMFGLESITAHFAVGGSFDRTQALGNVSMLGVAEAESALQLARKEAEGIEKRFNALLKKNRKLLLGSQH